MYLVPGGGVPGPWGGVPGPGGCTWSGGYLVLGGYLVPWGGVPGPRGGGPSPGGYLAPGGCTWSGTPPCGQTDACKLITLPQTSFAGGNKKKLVRLGVQHYRH